jgi:serine-type D-Ala-D-Ala carboxypeptidase/endopeptidase (penicillin-binding protein 4)
VALLLLSACTTDDGQAGSDQTSGTPTAQVGNLPEAAAAIMAEPTYDSARWLYYVADAETGEVLLANRPDEMVFTGSTAKEFVVGTAYEVLGPDTTLTTPVYATAPPADGVIDGDLVLVASGDLALGGRNAMEGKFDHTFVGDTVDHVYANIAPNAERIADPLAGLDALAGQVADRGITRVDGDVVIDTRIWKTFPGGDGPVTPIYVNDNLVDVQVTAGSGDGQPATIEVTPATDVVSVESTVTTVAEGGTTELSVQPSKADPTRLVVSGTIVSGSSQLTTYEMTDAADWARGLFVEALRRAGVRVAAPLGAPNDQTGLPPTGDYPPDQEVASLRSPPLSAMGSMILEVSYNKGANAFLCLLAVERGSTDCNAGLETLYATASAAGVDTDSLFLIDGQGTDPDSTTPRQISRWLQWSREQPWGQVFVDGQPVLAETGSLAPYGAGTPAAGKVAAKAGTSVSVDPVTERMYSKVQALSGYLTLEDGRVAVFGLSMSGATYPVLYDGLVKAGADLAGVAAAFQQAL